MTTQKKWSPEEKTTLREMFASGSKFDEIAQVIGRPASSVSGYAGYLGLRKSPTKKERKTAGYWRAWKPEEEDYLKAHYGKIPAASIASHLGRSIEAVIGRARRLGVSSNLHHSAHRISHQLGAERVRYGLQERKVGNTGDDKLDWKRIDVIEWESIHGTVPEGMVLIKRHGKPRTPENMKLVPISAFPPMHAIRSAPQDVRKLWNLKSQFNSVLGRIEKLHGSPDQTKDNRPRVWTSSEITYLLANYGSQSIKEIATALGRTEASVRSNSRRHRLTDERLTWSKSNSIRLASIYQDYSNAELASIFDCSQSTVKLKLKEMGLKRSKGAKPCQR